MFPYCVPVADSKLHNMVAAERFTAAVPKRVPQAGDVRGARTAVTCAVESDETVAPPGVELQACVAQQLLAVEGEGEAADVHVGAVGMGRQHTRHRTRLRLLQLKLVQLLGQALHPCHKREAESRAKSFPATGALPYSKHKFKSSILLCKDDLHQGCPTPFLEIYPPVSSHLDPNLAHPILFNEACFKFVVEAYRQVDLQEQGWPALTDTHTKLRII